MDEYTKKLNDFINNAITLNNDAAIYYLEVLQKYSLSSHMCSEVVKALAMGIDALEKQIPKTVDEDSERVFICPECAEEVSIDWNYCPSCGQKIDWSEEC